tara:strand:+ start:70 stop:288 length:219 start_codon:yes stop_codon:yes gene_type:complete
MVKGIDIEGIKGDFMIRWCGKVQDLTDLRMTKLSQSEMADLSGRSLRTIQRFENYDSIDAELMFIYNRVLNG